MIEIDNTYIYGWESAIRGMRNPMNSWDKSDTVFIPLNRCAYESMFELAQLCGGFAPVINSNDLDLMKRLVKAGTDHSKFMRMITVTCDLTAPLYWWKEYDTYKVGTVANSCSTMHKIQAKEFTLDDFSTEHLTGKSIAALKVVLEVMNLEREHFLATKDKDCWWQMIQLLPTSYNQKRTVQLNYAVLRNIYHSRRNHKLDEWHTFCHWIEGLPYSELITE